MPAGGGGTITDQSKRDLPILKRLKPLVPIDAVVKAIPRKKEVPTDAVILPGEMEDIQRSLRPAGSAPREVPGT